MESRECYGCEKQVKKYTAWQYTDEQGHLYCRDCVQHDFPEIYTKIEKGHRDYYECHSCRDAICPVSDRQHTDKYNNRYCGECMEKLFPKVYERKLNNFMRIQSALEKSQKINGKCECKYAEGPHGICKYCHRVYEYYE